MDKHKKKIIILARDFRKKLSKLLERAAIGDQINGIARDYTLYDISQGNKYINLIMDGSFYKAGVMQYEKMGVIIVGMIPNILYNMLGEYYNLYNKKTGENKRNEK